MKKKAKIELIISQLILIIDKLEKREFGVINKKANKLEERVAKLEKKMNLVVNLDLSLAERITKLNKIKVLY